MYRWDTSAGGRDQVCKEHDHAMDDIRYFAVTVAAKDAGREHAGSPLPAPHRQSGSDTSRVSLDKLNFDWRMNQMQFTFVPGDIEFKVTQQPDVVIKYIGGPLYVTPSPDPNYEPLDTKA